MSCGEIRKIDLRKGFAFVTMEDERGLRRALNLDGHKIMGRPVKISLKDTKERKRSRSRSPKRINSPKRSRRSPRRRSYSSSESSRSNHRRRHS